MKNYKSLLKNITTFIFDYDGVLTDGTVILQADGEALRTANVKDGYALQLAVKMGYNVAIISGGNSASMNKRFEALKIKDVVQAQKVKEVAVIEAQKSLEVAKLDRLAAAEYKEAKTMRAGADANAARKLIQADGALKQKLQTYENVMRYWADAYTKQRPTPDIVIGGDTKKGSGNAAEQFMNLLSIKALKDLSLDMKVKKK